MGKARISAQERTDRLMRELAEARRAIMEAVARLPPEARDTVFLGTWSVKDLIAHLIGWDWINLQAAHEVLAGQVPSFYGARDGDWQTLNARLVAEHRQEDFDRLLAAARESHDRLLAFLRALPAAELSKDRGIRVRGYRVTIDRLLEAERDDERTHARQVADFAATLSG